MSLENNRTGPILPPDFGTEPYYISEEQYQELESYIDDSCSFSCLPKKPNQKKGSLFSWPAVSRKYSTLAGGCGTRNKLLKHPRRQLPPASAFFGSFNGDLG